MGQKTSKHDPKLSFPTKDELLALVEAFDYRCQLTGLDLTPQTAAFDHRVPVSKGGSDCVHNLMLVHRTVNAMKGTLSLEEFVDWCHRVAVHCPPSGLKDRP